MTENQKEILITVIVFIVLIILAMITSSRRMEIRASDVYYRTPGGDKVIEQKL